MFEVARSIYAQALAEIDIRRRQFDDEALGYLERRAVGAGGILRLRERDSGEAQHDDGENAGAPEHDPSYAWLTL